MRVCECNPFKQCPDCDKRYLLNITTIDLYEHYYCFDTYEELVAAYNEVEETNEYCGVKYKPRTAIKFLPVSERR